jgi:N-acetyl-gamma-glutamyl-phosphate reductase
VKTVAIAGASGYAGGEMARLVSGHPGLELRLLAADKNEGRAIREIHPHLRHLPHDTFAATDVDALAAHDVVVLALPHGHSGPLGQKLIDSDAIVIDLGADRRLTDPADWAAYYGGEHYEAFSYAMPELVLADGTRQRSHLVGATRLAAPGCNATAVTLAVAPLVQAGLIEPGDIVSTLAVGPSGAGRTLREDLLASELLGSAHAYGAGGQHRHIPEIRQNLLLAGAHAPTVTVTPVLVPMSRGILAVNAARIAGSVSDQDLRDHLEKVYAEEAFVEVLPAGELPTTASVLGSNTVAIGLATDQAAGRVTVVSAIDNLVKGTAGAALQSLNIALGLDEATGLSADGVAP